MNTQFVFIADITPALVKFSIKVKVLCLWHQKGFGMEKQFQIMELILMDEKGYKIGATVRSKQRPKFQPILEEGGDYIIRDVSVAENKYKSIHISHPYKLVFAHKTMVKETTDWNGPMNGFQLLPFNDILSYSLDVDHTVDVIGHVVGIGHIKPFDNNGNPSKLMNVDIQDLDGLKICCTLWGKYVDQVSNFLDNKEPGNYAIIILQFAKTRDYLDHLTVSTDWYATKVFMNSDITEINDFKTRLIAISGNEKIKNLEPTTTSSIVTAKSFFDGCKNIGLDEFTPSMVGEFVVYATINSIIPDDDWCYIACRKCKRLTTPIDDDVDGVTVPIDVKLARDYSCVKCGPNPNVYLRFKVQIRVVNETGSASFTLFETDIMSMINKTAYDIRKSMGDDDDIPDDLNEIIGKKLLFKVSVTEFNKKHNYQVYTVVKYHDDEEHIKLFKEQYGSDEENQSYGSGTSENVLSSQLNSPAKDTISVTAENVVDVDLTISTDESRASKRIKADQQTTPLSVESSTTKSKKPSMSVMANKT